MFKWLVVTSPWKHYEQCSGMFLMVFVSLTFNFKMLWKPCTLIWHDQRRTCKCYCWRYGWFCDRISSNMSDPWNMDTFVDLLQAKLILLGLDVENVTCTATSSCPGSESCSLPPSRACLWFRNCQGPQLQVVKGQWFFRVVHVLFGFFVGHKAGVL